MAENTFDVNNVGRENAEHPGQEFIRNLMNQFDDITNGEEGSWSQICNSCKEKLAIPINLLDENAGSGICGAEGCNNEADHYVDF